MVHVDYGGGFFSQLSLYVRHAAGLEIRLWKFGNVFLFGYLYGY